MRSCCTRTSTYSGCASSTRCPIHRANDAYPPRGPRDECGVFGVYAPEHDVARLAYFGLYALQHRGQESAGIATCEGGHITTLRELGLVSQVFDEEKLRALSGDMAIGHVRYSTTGGGAWENAQPVWRDDGRELALAHNGNLTNAVELYNELTKAGVRTTTASWSASYHQPGAVPGVVDQTRNALTQQHLNYQKDLSEVAVIVAKNFAGRENEIGEGMAQIYATEFSEQELKDLVTFYKTPLGQKLLSSEPRAISGSMGWMNQWAQEFGVKVNDAFKEEMKKRNKPI